MNRGAWAGAAASCVALVACSNMYLRQDTSAAMSQSFVGIVTAAHETGVDGQGHAYELKREDGSVSELASFSIVKPGECVTVFATAKGGGYVLEPAPPGACQWAAPPGH